MRIALAIVGVVAILCASLGLTYNYSSFSGVFLREVFEYDPEQPYFTAAFSFMLGICTLCYLLLIVSGIQLIRQRLTWVWVFVGVQFFQIVYFFSIAVLWLSDFIAPGLGRSVAAATGVANGGLMVQFLVLLPLWGTMLALVAKRKLEAAPTNISTTPPLPTI